MQFSLLILTLQLHYFLSTKITWIVIGFSIHRGAHPGTKQHSCMEAQCDTSTFTALPILLPSTFFSQRCKWNAARSANYEMGLCYRQMVTGMTLMTYSPLSKLKASSPEIKRYHTIMTPWLRMTWSKHYSHDHRLCSSLTISKRAPQVWRLHSVLNSNSCYAPDCRTPMSLMGLFTCHVNKYCKYFYSFHTCLLKYFQTHF